jgi:hypothetical protein
MKKILLLVLLIPSLAFAGQGMGPGPGVKGYAGGGGGTLYCTSSTSDGTTTWLKCEDFEGSGSCDTGTGDTCWATWSCGGTQQSTCGGAYTTAPCDAGLPIDSGNAEYLAGTGSCYTTFTTAATVYGYEKIRFPVYAGANDNFLNLADSSGTLLFGLTSTGGGTPKIRLTCGSGSSDGSTTISTGTAYNIWFDYTKGTGANAVCHVYISTTSTKGSAEVSITNGDATGDAVRLYNKSVSTGVESIVDRIRISSSSMAGIP